MPNIYVLGLQREESRSFSQRATDVCERELRTPREHVYLADDRGEGGAVHTSAPWFRPAVAAALALGLAAVSACSDAPRGACDASTEIATICGFENPEDLALVEGGDVVVSQMRRDDRGGTLAVWSGEGEAPRVLWPGPQTPGIAAGPTAADPACPPPEVGAFSPHGIFAAPPGLWVVNHGARESVEVFGLARENGALRARWLGCIELPEGTSANDVAIGRAGEVVVSNMSAPGAMILASLTSQLGYPTGDVLVWESAAGWKHVPGTGARMANGVAISADGAWIYYAESGAGRVVRVRPDGSDRTEIPIPGRPDNLAWDADGRLYVAAHDSFWGLARCLRNRPCRGGWAVFSIAPGSTEPRLVVRHDGSRLGAVASAQPAEGRLYLSAVFDDRIGVWSPPATW